MINEVQLPEFEDEFSLTARKAGSVLLKDIDFELQLAAISDLLALTRGAKSELTAKMKEMDQLARSSTDWRNDYYVELWGEHFYISVYQDAAHSMAAVGMLAPFVESLFFQGFTAVGRDLYHGNTNVPSSQRAEAAGRLFWDCGSFYNGHRWEFNLVKGIMQLAESCALKQYLPEDTGLVLEALFAYRHKMFHCGFEWPQEERHKFSERIRNSNWSEQWLSKATRENEPWIFYMTREFVELIFVRIGEWIEAFGMLYLEHFPCSAMSK